MTWSVEELTGIYERFLITPPGKRQGACPTCRGLPGEGYVECFNCHDHQGRLGDLVADAVLPISLSIPLERQHSRNLWLYKNSKNASQRRECAPFLAALLIRFINSHLSCLANRAGIARFSVFTTVPSTSGRAGEHPLDELVSRHMTLHGLELGLLSLADPTLPARQAVSQRFRCNRRLASEGVVVIDDTWTSGARAQSAAAALKIAGASKVGVIVMGRYFHGSPRDDRASDRDIAFLERAEKERPFTWNKCAFDWDDGDGLTLF